MIVRSFARAALQTSLPLIVVVLAIQLSGQDSSEPPPKPKPSSSTPSSNSSSKSTSSARTTAVARASLLIVPDVACKVMVDDRDLGALLPGHPKSIRVELGDHMIEAHATSGHGEWQDTVTVEKPVQVVVKTEIKKVLAEEEEAATRQAEAIEQERRQAAAREAAAAAKENEAAETRRKHAEALSALQGRWVYSGENLVYEFDMRMDGETLTGSLTKRIHIPSEYQEGACETIQVPSTAGAIANGLSGCVSCPIPTVPKTSCSPGTTTRTKDVTAYFTIQGRARNDGQVFLKGTYERCSGDCKSVSNPHSLDIGERSAELRDGASKLYWGGKQFDRQ